MARDELEQKHLLVPLPAQLAAVDLEHEAASVRSLQSVVGVDFTAVERLDLRQVEVGKKLPRSFEVHY